MTTDKEPVPKYTRSVNLDPHMAERLQRVCDHLGVTVNSYLKLKIGEVVSRDETSLVPKQVADQSAALLEQFFRAAMVVDEQGQLELEVDDQPKTTRKPRAPKAK